MTEYFLCSWHNNIKQSSFIALLLPKCLMRATKLQYTRNAVSVYSLISIQSEPCKIYAFLTADDSKQLSLEWQWRLLLCNQENRPNHLRWVNNSRSSHNFPVHLSSFSSLGTHLLKTCQHSYQKDVRWVVAGQNVAKSELKGNRQFIKNIVKVRIKKRNENPVATITFSCLASHPIVFS